MIFFIQVWILTGDKKETAINISRSCGHLRKGMEIIDLAGIENPQTIENMMTRKLQDTALDRSQNWCLIVDGTTLTSIFLPTNKSDTVLQQFLIFLKSREIDCKGIFFFVKSQGSIIKKFGKRLCFCHLLPDVSITKSGNYRHDERFGV